MPPPDADLHPEATGLAKTLANGHSAPQPLKLYAGWFCPFVQRVWTVLEEKNIPYQYIEAKSESLLKLNSRGLVPTLEYDNKPLYESTVFCEFLEDAYPDHGLKLPLAGRPLYQGQDENLDRLRCVRSDFLGTLRQFAEAMEEEGPFFLGKAPSLLILSWRHGPFELWIFDDGKDGLGMPEQGKSGDDKARSQWRRWLAAIQNRTSIKETTSDRERYIPIYKRYADNTAQSELTKATREGKGVP